MPSLPISWFRTIRSQPALFWFPQVVACRCIRLQRHPLNRLPLTVSAWKGDPLGDSSRRLPFQLPLCILLLHVPHLRILLVMYSLFNLAWLRAFLLFFVVFVSCKEKVFRDFFIFLAWLLFYTACNSIDRSRNLLHIYKRSLVLTMWWNYCITNTHFFNLYCPDLSFMVVYIHFVCLKLIFILVFLFDFKFFFLLGTFIYILVFFFFYFPHVQLQCIYIIIYIY